MEKITFQNLWKNKPKEKSVMVSDYLKHCLPYMKTGKDKTKHKRLQDPFYRIMGKKRYGMDLNKLLRERYGNIYF